MPSFSPDLLDEVLFFTQHLLVTPHYYDSQDNYKYDLNLFTIIQMIYRIK